MAQQTFMYQGKEQTMWTEKQLESMGKASLKQRAMVIRDLVGDNMKLPPTPAHIDLLPAWIMGAQAAMQRQQGGGRPESRASAHSQRDEDEVSVVSTEHSKAFLEAKGVREAMQQRSRASNIFGGGGA
eukprot:CAMPEP_0115057392 /NCGR_PEP_ID=MMETSP0227-20121206/5729_1 /TAXON_ID=89957 /ORGANISM="Polarella glacialis, Strain CCMP 1383" /LENGTH=127 /DNA_ID=CAMNT_0002442183 /DNA_START=67 /DNA_END=450 /DNA_ORIENTATION=-